MKNPDKKQDEFEELKCGLISRRQSLQKAGKLAAGALAFGATTGIIGYSASLARGAGYNLSLDRGEEVLRNYGLSTSLVKTGVAGQTFFNATYKTRGWLGNTTVTDSLGSKNTTTIQTAKIPSRLAGVEVYQSTFYHRCRVIANGKSLGILIRSFFIKGGPKYIPLATYANRWYKNADSDGYVTVFDFRQKIAMMKRTQGRVNSYFCDAGVRCPVVGLNTHSAGELMARLLDSKEAGPKLEWLAPGEPCHLVVSSGGNLFSANIAHRASGLMMAIPGHGSFGIEFEGEKDFVLSMPGESFGMDRGKVLKISLKRK